MGWANNNSIIKKYGAGDYAASTYATQNIIDEIGETNLIGKVEEQLLGEKEQDVKTDFSERTQGELEEAVEAANKKSAKYGKWSAGLGFLSNFIPGWGKFVKMGIDTVAAGKQKDIFKSLSKKGALLEGTFLEKLGQDFTKGYEELAEGFDPLMAGVKSIAGSYLSEGVSKTVDKFDPTAGPQTIDEAVKGAEIAEDAGYTAKDLQRGSEYTGKDWAMDETIDPKALEGYEKLAADFKPGEIMQEEKTYGEMTLQERLKDVIPEFKKGDSKGNLMELFAQYQEKGPLLAQLLSEEEEGAGSLEDMFRGYGY